MELKLPTRSFRQATRSQEGRSTGFTLAEVIVGVALLGLFLLMCTGIVQAGHRLFPGRTVAVAGDVLPIAPSSVAFADAVKLHSLLIERLNTARAVYVLGGSHQGLPTGASRLRCAPLAISGLPLIESFAPGLPTDAYAFYQTYAGQLGELAGEFSPRDFTVAIVGPWNGQLALTALVQVKERAISGSDQTQPMEWMRRDTILYDISGDRLVSSFLEKPQVALIAGVGARHHWYRYFEDRVAEEGPVMTVFPDPWLYAGTQADQPGQPPPFSRFAYLLAVSP